MSMKNVTMGAGYVLVWFFAVVSTWCLPSPVCAFGVWKVERLKSPCVARLADRNAWSSLRTGQVISPYTIVSVGEGGRLVLSYDGGTRVGVRGPSLIQLLYDGYRVQYGGTWVRAARTSRGFSTYTPNMVVSVRGTRYLVDVFGAENAFWRLPSLYPRIEGYTPRSHLVAGELLRNMLGGVRGIYSSVSVFEGVVEVSCGGEGGLLRLGEGRKVVVGGRGEVLAKLSLADEEKERVRSLYPDFLPSSGAVVPGPGVNEGTSGAGKVIRLQGHEARPSGAAPMERR